MNTTTKTEIIAKPTTFDGIRVLVWSDGSITDCAGRGVSRVRVSVATVIVIAGDVAIFTWPELPAVMKAAAKAERAGAVGIRSAIRAVGTKKPAPRNQSPRRLGAEGRPHTLQDWRAHLEICRAIRCKVCG